MFAASTSELTPATASSQACRSVTLALFLAAACASAQPALTLRVSGARFHQGELIPFSLEVPQTSSTPDRLYQFGGFLLDPPSGCGTLDAPCFELTPSGGGGYSPVMGGEINAYVRTLKPGHYRVRGLFALEVLQASGPLSRTFGYAEPRQYLFSEPAEFEVVPATPEWQRRTVAAAVKTLIEGDSYEAVEMRQAAAHELRYLQIPQAWEAELDQLDKSERELMAGLDSAADPKTVCAMMRTRLVQPAQYIGRSYLSVLGRLCGGMDGAGQITAEAAATLASHLEEKTPAVRIAALDALIRYAADRIHNPGGNSPPILWLDAVRRETLRQWPRMDEHYQKLDLEEWQWAVIQSPEMAPLLEARLDRGRIQDTELWTLAVRRLNEFAPARAQALILADMLEPASRVDESTLALLPREATRGLTPKLIAALAAAQSGNGGDSHRIMGFLARFGDAAALPRIKAIFESQTDACQPELLAYLLRVDAAYADTILHRQPWDMHAPAPACAARYFAVTARLYMAPELERFTIAYLMHENVQVKLAAAESLGRYGTAAAEAPLWDTFRYFHEYWKDRRALLKEHPEGEFLEVALRTAIARGAAWRAAEAGLRLMDSLCISERCRYETLNDLENLRQPLTVEVEGDRWRVAQYSNIASLDALERKLAQFPAGTTFRLRVWSAERERVIEQLKQFGARNGLSFQLTS